MAALERARQLDPDLPGVDLQLGIAYQRGGNARRAAQALDRALERDPSDAAAHFFRGLAAERRGDGPVAERHLLRAAQLDAGLAPDAWLEVARVRVGLGDRDGALRALDRVSAAGAHGETAAAAHQLRERVQAGELPTRRWWASGSAGLEYDDNLTVSELDVTTGQSDVAGVFTASAGARLLERGPDRLEASYDFSQSLYAQFGDLDLQTHTIALEAGSELAGLDPTLGYRFLHATLGGDDFLDLHHVTLGLGTLLAPRWYATVGYHFEDRRLAEDEARDATRLALSADHLLFLGERRAQARLGWRLELQDARDDEFDYLGNTLVLGIESVLPVSWLERPPRGQLEWDFEARNYSAITASIGEKRQDRRHTVRLQLAQPLLRHLSAVLEYRFVSSNSNLPSQDYDENVVGVRAEAAF